MKEVDADYRHEEINPNHHNFLQELEKLLQKYNVETMSGDEWGVSFSFANTHEEIRDVSYYKAELEFVIDQTL